MRPLCLVFALTISHFFMACSHHNDDIKDDMDKDEIKLEHVEFTVGEDAPEPPPPGLTSRFKNVEEWLLHIADTERPQKPITAFHFGLFEGEDDYILFLTGMNTYELSKNYSENRIDFEPEEMYFPLPKGEYKDLNRTEVLNRLTAQLKKFTTTEKFKHSFLKEANSIRTDWEGEIWSK